MEAACYLGDYYHVVVMVAMLIAMCYMHWESRK